MADNRCKLIFDSTNKITLLLVASRTFTNSNSTRNNTNNFRFDNNHNERNHSQQNIPNTNDNWDIEADENSAKPWLNISKFSMFT